MEYIAIQEWNFETRYTFVFYCQWTGNEVELEKLLTLIELSMEARAGAEGEVSTFQVSRRLIPESVVDIQVSLKELGYPETEFVLEEGKSKPFPVIRPLFLKCSGKFTFPQRQFETLEKAHGREPGEYQYEYDTYDDELVHNIHCDRDRSLYKLFGNRRLKNYFEGGFPRARPEPEVDSQDCVIV